MIMIPIMILSTHLVQGAFVPCGRGALWSLCSIIALRSGSTCSVIGDCFFFDDVDSLRLGGAVLISRLVDGPGCQRLRVSEGK